MINRRIKEKPGGGAHGEGGWVGKLCQQRLGRSFNGRELGYGR